MVQHNSNSGTNNTNSAALAAQAAQAALANSAAALGMPALPALPRQAPAPQAAPQGSNGQPWYRAAPPPTAPQAAAAPAPVQPPKGLTLQAQRCLQALLAAGALVGSGHAGLTRKQLHTRTGQAKGWAALLGAPTRAGGQAGAAGLQARGLVACQQQGGVLVYWLTPAGQAALAANTGAPTA
jgi:hypothetical protein